MAEPAATAFKVGDIVKIRLSGFRPGKIVEYRGPLGPGGAHIYRVRVRGKPYPAYTEVREDQLELVPAGS
ncbi:MAG TPA: hypothetical protein VMS17_11830 [Gemmataceae bacterium]|nr:hypothetical protein [Gemmataceae bacterium]